MKIYLEKFSIFLKINRHRMSTTSSFKVIRILRVKITSNFLFFVAYRHQTQMMSIIITRVVIDKFVFIHWNQWILYSVLFFFVSQRKEYCLIKITYRKQNNQRHRRFDEIMVIENHRIIFKGCLCEGGILSR